MSRWVYLNGRYLPFAEAGVGVEDRGFLFADGIYEVWGVRAGRMFDMDGHMRRLFRSLRELEIAPPLSEAALKLLLRQVLSRNRICNGMVYLQITRGQAPRDFAFPPGPPRPTVMIMAKAVDLAAQERRAAQGVAVSTQQDLRWGRCDIKSVSLLGNVLAKEKAKRAGAYEALLIDENGQITEGASSNFWMVSQAGVLVTRDLGANILPGVTRAALITLASRQNLALHERAFTPQDAQAGREAFLSSAIAGVMPVVTIDGVQIGDGQPGPMAMALRRAYLALEQPERPVRPPKPSRSHAG